MSPQRYFWRISIALHVGPRFIIAICYKSYYVYLLQCIKDSVVHAKATWLMNLAFWLHIIEITSLCGVTYVSNRENYSKFHISKLNDIFINSFSSSLSLFSDLHEQVFIVFIACSLGHMLVTIKMCQLLQQNINAKQHPHAVSIIADPSIKWKRTLFALSIVSTIGLVVFFFKHRVYCHDLAFSAFAFCEYVIAIANLAFHCITVWDFPTQYLMIANGSSKIKLHQPLGWKSDWDIKHRTADHTDSYSNTRMIMIIKYANNS